MQIWQYFVMRDLRGKLCNFPYWRFEIHIGGELFHCCPTWLPISVGNIQELTFLEAMRSEKSTRIRASMEAGEFAYCEKKLCPYLSAYLNTGDLRAPIEEATPAQFRDSFARDKRISISLSYDRSCNLRCPSCRNELILYSEDTIPADVLSVHNAVLHGLQELLDAGYFVHLNITGSGDAFASPLHYKLLRELPYSANLAFEIQTNGVLMEEKRFTDSLYKMTKFLAVSVDAASKTTYELVRRGGNFDRLKANLDWIDSAIRAGRFPQLDCYKVNFIVQKDNFAEIVPFAQWMLSYSSVTEIWFNCIADWGHLGTTQFNERAVWKKDHPQYQDFLATITDPILRDKRVNLGNLNEFLR